MKKILAALFVSAALVSPVAAQTSAVATAADPSYSSGIAHPLSMNLFGYLRTLSQISGTVTITGTVTANAGTNLNTSALALETGGNLAQLVTDFGAPGAVACTTDTASCNLNQYVQRLAQRLSTINTTLGTPLQAGGSLAANQSTNESQINGVAPLMNNGASGTGSQRINVANDNTAIANWGQGAAGSAAPSGAQYAGANSSGNLTGIIQADNSVAINISTGTTTTLVALSAGKKIYVTSFDVIAGGTGNITFVYGTGASCGTGTTSLTGAYNLTAQTGIAKGNGLGPVLVIPASNALCAITTASVQMSGGLSYTQF